MLDLILRYLLSETQFHPSSASWWDAGIQGHRVQEATRLHWRGFDTEEPSTSRTQQSKEFQKRGVATARHDVVSAVYTGWHGVVFYVGVEE